MTGSVLPTYKSPFALASFEDFERRCKADEDAGRLRDVLAESTASDVKDLRLALARIVVNDHGMRSYGSCACGGDRSCLGHVPETMKIARAALGLSELPDRERVPLPDEAPPKPKRKPKPRPKKAAK